VGHKGSQKFSGARGQMPAPEIETALEAALDRSVQELAAGHRERAIEILAECMDSSNASWAAKCTAARDILAYADGRPHAQAVRDTADTGITINIVRLTDGRTETIEVKTAARVIDAPTVITAQTRAEQLLGIG